MSERRAIIAVVEDEPIVATDLSELLGELGYACCGTARSCAEALDLAASHAPDLVLMDIHIEGPVDGIETARLLRDRQRVPVVFLTAFSDEATLRRAGERDPLGYVVKPVNPRELRVAIEVGLARKRSDDALRARERWLSTTLRAIGDAVVAVGVEGEVRSLNARAEELTGFTQAQAEGRPVEEVLSLVDERSLRPVPNPARAALAAGRPAELPPHAALSTPGRLCPVEGNSAPIVDNGERLGAVVVLRDVSGRRELERRVEHADRLASLGMIAAGVAHEINNPLTFVSGNATFVRAALADGAGPATPSDRDELVCALDDVLAGGDRIRRIVADLRTFARADAGKTGPVDVAESVRWALRLLGQSVRERARLVEDLPALPPVLGNELRLGQVFLNLIQNAVQALGPGDPARHEVGVRARAEGLDRVRVEVWDTGAGVAAEHLPNLFTPFFTTKGPGQGTGLGLAVSHGIVRAFGGEIDVASEPGVRTTFSVLLPVARASLAPLPSTEPPPEPAKLPASGRVAVIDDEPIAVEAVRRLLSPPLEVEPSPTPCAPSRRSRAAFSTPSSATCSCPA